MKNETRDKNFDSHSKGSQLTDFLLMSNTGNTTEDV